MAKLPKKPTPKALPKRPKASSSYETWERYEDKCIAVRKANKKMLDEWKKNVARIQANEKKKKAIMEKTRGLGRI